MRKSFIFIFAIVFIISSFSGCGRTEISDQVVNPGSVTVETFGSGSLPGSAEETQETEPPYYMTFSEQTSPIVTTQVTDTTSSEASTSPTDGFSSEASDTEGDSLTITECSLIMYASSSVNIRKEPDPDSKRLGHLDKGEMVTVTGMVSNGWCRILIDGEECFVNGKYLDETPPETTEPSYTVATTDKTAEPTTVTTTEPPVTTTVSSAEEDTHPSRINTITPAPIDRRDYNALNYDVQKAVWFAFLDIKPMLSDATAASFTESIREAFGSVKDMGFNTVYVHVRSHGDAYYYSLYYPFTAAYSGTPGVLPDFDPLEIMIAEAHALGLSFHAWVNPMRTTNEENFENIPGFYAIKQWHDSDSAKGKYIVYNEEDSFYWLSPAYTAVKELICNGIIEIVSGYDVDGIHIDDYFYPTTDKSFDKEAFSVSGRDDLGDWRREVVSALVADIYSSVKSCNKTVQFGVSPQGNRENNRNKLYADIEKWCRDPGYLDYIVPQIYYGYSGKLPFDTTAYDWQSVVTNKNVKLIAGIAAYKVGSNSEWKSGDMLYNQTTYIDSLPGYSGCAYYRYESIVSSDSYMKTELKKLIGAIKELK